MTCPGCVCWHRTPPESPRTREDGEGQSQLWARMCAGASLREHSWMSLISNTQPPKYTGWLCMKLMQAGWDYEIWFWNKCTALVSYKKQLKHTHSSFQLTVQSFHLGCGWFSLQINDMQTQSNDCTKTQRNIPKAKASHLAEKMLHLQRQDLLTVNSREQFHLTEIPTASF